MTITPHKLNEYAVDSTQINIKFSYLQRGVYKIKIISEASGITTVAFLDANNNEIRRAEFPSTKEVYVVE